MPTTPTQMRLTEDDRAKVREIRERMGLPSDAAAIRYAVDRTHRGLEKNPRKSEKRA